MPIRKYEFQIYADYYQFYLEDENSPHETDKVWDSEGTAYNRMLGVGEGLIAVGTARYETVSVSVELHDSEPVLELEKYSRVNECSLQVKSGKLLISGCLEYLPDAARIAIEPSNYWVRVLYGNLETVKDDWEGEDFYVLQLWKEAEVREISTLKS